MGLHIDLSVAKPELKIPEEASIKNWIATAVDIESTNRRTAEEKEISVRIVDDNEMSGLNKQFRQKTGTTNVLSFPCEMPADIPSPLLGDIIISATRVRLEAKEQSKDEQAHWAHLLVHGTLHLLGYDHINEEEAITMEHLETAILAELGFPNPYIGDEAITARNCEDSHPLQPPSL